MNDNYFKTKVRFSDDVETRSWCWVSSCRCSLTFSHSWRFPTRPISMKPRIQHSLIQTGFSKAFYDFFFQSIRILQFPLLFRILVIFIAFLLGFSDVCFNTQVGWKWHDSIVSKYFEFLENPPDHLHTWRRLQRTVLVCFRHFQVHAIAQRCHRFLLLAVPQVLLKHRVPNLR